MARYPALASAKLLGCWLSLNQRNLMNEGTEETQQEGQAQPVESLEQNETINPSDKLNKYYQDQADATPLPVLGRSAGTEGGMSDIEVIETIAAGLAGKDSSPCKQAAIQNIRTAIDHLKADEK